MILVASVSHQKLLSESSYRCKNVLNIVYTKTEVTNLGLCVMTIIDREGLECVHNPPLHRDRHIVRQSTFYLLQFSDTQRIFLSAESHYLLRYSIQARASHKYTHIK